MKNGILIFILLLIQQVTLHSQFNVSKMLEHAPLIPPTIGTAFLNSKLIISKETLLDGREFKRVKSWEPAGEIKKFSEMLDSYVEKIDKRAEENSFSLNYIPEKDKEIVQYLNWMTKVADSTKLIWKKYHQQITAINPDFLPLTEEFGCDEIAQSGQKLNGFAEQKNKILELARKDLFHYFDLTQRYFNKLYQIEDPMFNNQVMNEISKPLQVLQEWSFEVNSANSNMVDTGVSLNNALCTK